MPIVPANGVQGQIGPSVSGPKPYVQQQNFGQMIGEVSDWNTSCSVPIVQNIINNVARKLYDRRLWYSLMIKGQLLVPAYYSTGQVQVTNNSPSVVGINTTWTAALIGRSLRVGYNNPIYNIINVDVANQVLTLELPWGSPSYSSVGYFIAKYYYSIPNIKYIYSAKNLQLQYRLWTNMTQAYLDNVDPSRLQLIYPKVIAGMPPDAFGNWQCELWPASTTQQAIPYIAYTQPPNLVEDEDTLPPYLRCDIVKAGAIADVLRYRSKSNPDYSESAALSIATEKMKEFEAEARQLEYSDENLYRADVQIWEEQMPFADLSMYGGAMLDAMSARGGGGGWDY